MRILGHTDLSRFERKKMFLWSYFLMMFGLFASVTEFMPAPSVFAKSKFVFIGVCMVDILYNKGIIKKFRNNVFAVFILLFSNAVFFGVFAVNPLVKEETEYHFVMSVLYFIMLFLVFYELEYYKCYLEFLKCSYLALAIILMLSFVLNFNRLSLNPLFVFRSFFGVRTRSTVGLGHWNYAGLFCFITLVISYFIYIELKKRNELNNNKKFLIFILVVDIATFFVLNTVTSRSPTVSLIIFILLHFCYLIYKKMTYKSKKIISLMAVPLLLIVVLILNRVGFFDFVWEGSNRALNISVNYPAFKEVGNPWTGMGWVETGEFQHTAEKNWLSAWGVRTSSLDMYYIYVYFTTGTIGCIFIGMVLLIIGYSLAKRTRNLYDFSYFALYLSILFYSFWATILFTYKFWQVIILLCILMHQMNTKYTNTEEELACV